MVERRGWQRNGEDIDEEGKLIYLRHLCHLSFQSSWLIWSPVPLTISFAALDASTPTVEIPVLSPFGSAMVHFCDLPAYTGLLRCLHIGIRKISQLDSNNAVQLHQETIFHLLLKKI